MFKNFSETETYRTFLYKKVDGQIQSKIFVGEEDAQKGLDDGWKMSPAAFVDEHAKDSELSDYHVEKVKDAADMFARDADILANADKIDDIGMLKKSYEQFTGKPMSKRISTLKGARNAIKNLLGDLDGNSPDVH